MVEPRYNHLISLNKEQNALLKKAVEKTKLSIPKTIIKALIKLLQDN